MIVDGSNLVRHASLKEPAAIPTRHKIEIMMDPADESGDVLR